MHCLTNRICTGSLDLRSEKGFRQWRIWLKVSLFWIQLPSLGWSRKEIWSPIRLTDMDTKTHDSSILAEQSPFNTYTQESYLHRQIFLLWTKNKLFRFIMLWNFCWQKFIINFTIHFVSIFTTVSHMTIL